MTPQTDNGPSVSGFFLTIRSHVLHRYWAIERETKKPSYSVTVPVWLLRYVTNDRDENNRGGKNLL